MQRRLLFSCIVMLLLTFVSTAAPNNNARLSGKVNDEATNKGLAFVSVALMDASGELFAAGATNEQGSYVFTGIPAGTYLLKISLTGYVATEITIEISGEEQEIEQETIILQVESRQLDAVTITAKKPLLERKIDKLVMNVAEAISTEGSNGIDILRKAPGVVLDQSGNVLLNGQVVAVWIDNRPSNLSGADLVAILNAMDGGNINKIELMANPSAKYDAEGAGGIINILTKKNFLMGFSGSVKGTGGYYLDRDGYSRFSGSGNLNYRNNWWNSAITYSAQQFNGFLLSETDTEYGQERRHAYQFDDLKNFSQTFKFANDFYINEKNVLGLTLSGMWNNWDYAADDSSHTNVYENGVQVERVDSKGETESKSYNYAANLNYQHIFGAMHELSVNADYMRYVTEPSMRERNYFSYSDTTTANYPLLFNDYSKQAVDILSFKADYARPLGNRGLLQAGGKFAQSYTDNLLQRDDFITFNGWQRNDSISNKYNYTERIGALYATAWIQLSPKWSVQAGLRWENTWSKGNWGKAANSDTTTSQQYNDFFPNLFVSYVPSEKHYFTFSYSKRILRPGYESLNPFRSYIGAYTYGEGNPALLPEYIQSLNLGYTFSQFLNVSLSVQHSNQVMTQVMNVDTLTGITAITWNNFGKSTTYGLSTSMSQIMPAKWWYINLYLNGYYMQSIAPDYDNDCFYGSVYFANTFLIGKTWQAEVCVNAQSKMLLGYFTVYPAKEVWVGVKKTLWQGKGSLSLYLNDAFNSQKTRSVSDYNGQRIDVRSHIASRLLNLSFTYRFGKSGNERQRSDSELEESSRLKSAGKQ